MKRFQLKPLAAAFVASTVCAFTAPAFAADMPATEHQADVLKGVEQANRNWAKRVENMPVTKHQREVLDDFNAADENKDGYLSAGEYESFTQQRADRVFNYTYYTENGAWLIDNPTNRKNITAAAMLGLDDKFKQADRSKDGALGVLEVYYYETFDRPGLFPSEDEAVPQDVTGHWENMTVGEHAKVFHKIPFSSETHKQPIEEGGFTAVDDNDDGIVSLFEASDFSMLDWTGAARAFANADTDGNAALNQSEFNNFKQALAELNLQSDRPGEFPSGQQSSQ